MNLDPYFSLIYVSNGRDERGVDCWGLTRLIYKNEFGIELPSYSGRYKDSDNQNEVSDLVSEAKSDWIEIPKGQEQVGDITILYLLGYPMHIGVVVSRNNMIHIMKRINVVIEDYTSRRWEKRIFGFVRHKEMMNDSANRKT